MRNNRNSQIPLTQNPIDHKHTRELTRIGDILDEHPEITKAIQDDLLIGVINPNKGRVGMSGDQVLRALIIKQMNGYDYDDLAFHIRDSSTYQAFCRYGIADKWPTDSTLQRNIKMIRPETLEAVNRIIVSHAAQEGIEKGRVTRTDCTVTETTIHKPSDSSLLWDSVRVLTRLMGQAQELTGIPYPDHTLRAKRRALGILNAGTNDKRKMLYRDLIKVTNKTVLAAERVVADLENFNSPDFMADVKAQGLATEIRHYLALTTNVLDQTKRRVFLNEQVPSTEKIVSIFEPHTDIIVKDRRETQYGHKVCLTIGESGMIIDQVVLDGNPADSTLPVDMVLRQIEILGRPPRQVSFDGGFASKENLAAIKKLGVKDVAFSKRRGLKILDMVKSTWVYKKLRDFRAGVEGCISFLKRCFGLDRCTWKSLPSFKAYAWASTLTANLLVMARHLLA